MAEQLPPDSPAEPVDTPPTASMSSTPPSSAPPPATSAPSAPPPTAPPLPPLDLPDDSAGSGRPGWEKWALGLLAIVVLGFLAMWLMRDKGSSAVPPTPPVSPTSAASVPTVGAPTAAAPTLAAPPANPEAKISGPTSGTVGQPMTFSATGSTAASNIVIYTWDFGDGTQAAGAEVTHAYDLAGNFVVRLGVQDTTGQLGGARQSIAVAAAPSPPPSAVISGPTAAQTGQSLTFSGTASTAPNGGTITAYAWTFGDGAQATGATVSHAYSQPGNYSVALNVTAASGSDSASQQVVVTSPQTPQPPKAVIQGPTTAMVGQTVNFNGSASTSSSPITAWLWKFGDGSGTNAIVASYAYDTPGSYTVSLTVVDQTGAQNSTTSQIQVAAAPSQPPKAVLTGPSVATTGAPVTFSASTSTAGSSPITSYNWTVNGVPAPTSGDTLTYTFPLTGNFVVEVIVTDQTGASDAASQTVVVSPDMTSAVWVLNGSVPPITLSVANGQGGGSSGCNTYQLTYTVASQTTSGSVTMGPISSTARTCQSGVMAQEQMYIATLQGVTSYTIAGGQMQLVGPGGTLSYTMR